MCLISIVFNIFAHLFKKLLHMCRDNGRGGKTRMAQLSCEKTAC